MPNREEVINRLNNEITHNEYWDEEYADCVPVSLLKDALELLKAQEPRVMTLEEINGMEWDYCYVEDERIMDKALRMMYGEHRIHCITWPSIASYKMFYGEAGYGKRWRCWTSRPTDEQRKATPWAEPPKEEEE